MKKNFYSSIIVFALVIVSATVNGQGCVAVKNMASCSINWGDENIKGFQASANYRYFRSYKHFVGTDEQEERVEQGTEVINNDNSINFGLNYVISKRWSVSAFVPYMWIDRSSMYEHLGNAYPGQTPPNANNPNYERYHTQSRGIGDVRLMGYFNTLGSYEKGYLTVGLGLKLPTGKNDVTDTFHKPEGLQEGIVDQSIQRGDGRLGYIAEVDFTHKISGPVYAYFQGMYMLAPANTNGVERSPTPTKTYEGEVIEKSNEFSVPDQYLVRAGGRVVVKSWQISLGGRMECIPSKDLIGESDGFRRPGYIISVEPSVFYTMGAHSFGVNLPIAAQRNRTRSQIDIERGTNPVTGNPAHGDAAFADWLLSMTYAYKFGK
jgi:hypothetical protein